MAVSLYFKDGSAVTAIPLGSFSVARESVTVTDSTVKDYTVAASFSKLLLVYLDGLLCRPTSSYTVSGQVVTFVDSLPVGSEIDFVAYS